ncbi:MAG: Type 1 glutamine amidotransferase-like domain-containing protein, partial [Vicinamibacterales bacterium]|nr:Type 1 glutamine amidotransferase-like domain-containing protein [Vicinamibacterales bacterium]
MERREFIKSTALGTVGLGATNLAAAPARPAAAQAPTPKILIAGGGYGTTFIKYMAELTGKSRPKICYLPTASASSEVNPTRWYENCAPLDIIPSVQRSFIASTRMDQTWEEALLSVDGIVVSGGN